MKFIYLILAWVAGTFVASFFFWQPVIILVFGIPFTFHLKRLGVVTSTRPVFRYTVSFVILTSLLVLSTWAMWHYASKYIWGYVLGFVLTFPGAFQKCGRTPANVREYYETNSEYIDQDALNALSARDTFTDEGP